MKQKRDVDFSGLILGFSSAALHYMGEGVVDGSQKVEKDLARYNIDIIQLLKSKTEGNLSADETELLNQVLVDLEAKFNSL